MCAPFSRRVLILKIVVGVGGKLDLTTWDFSKAECDTKLVECSKPLLLIGWIPDSSSCPCEQKQHRSWYVGQRAHTRGSACGISSVNCTTCRCSEDGTFFHTHPHSADSPDQPLIVDIKTRFPSTFQTVTDSRLLGPRAAPVQERERHQVNGVKTSTRWLTSSGYIAQLLSTPSHSLSLYQMVMKAMSQQLLSDRYAEAGYSRG